jgi:hypothetical protein
MSTVNIGSLGNAQAIGWADAQITRLGAGQLAFSPTWNDAGTTFAGLRMNVTDTASTAASLLMDLQVGGASQFSVRKDGHIAAARYLDSTRVYGLLPNVSGASFIDVASSLTIRNANAAFATIFRADAFGVSIGPSADTILARDAANTLAQRNGTNAQAFRVYNTFTDASNYERGFMRWNSNVFEIGTEAAGTGTARGLEIRTGGTTRLSFAGTTSAATFVGDILAANLRANTSGYLYWNTRSNMTSPADGVIRLTNAADSDFNRLQFGGTTSSFPSLKRSSTVLQSRLADDSDFATLQGQLRSHANAVAETPTATHTITIYDAAGTAYKVLCVAV